MGKFLEQLYFVTIQKLLLMKITFVVHPKSKINLLLSKSKAIESDNFSIAFRRAITMRGVYRINRLIKIFFFMLKIPPQRIKLSAI